MNDSAKMMMEIAESAKPGHLKSRREKVKEIFKVLRFGSPKKATPLITSNRKSAKHSLKFRWL